MAQLTYRLVMARDEFVEGIDMARNARALVWAGVMWLGVFGGVGRAQTGPIGGTQPQPNNVNQPLTEISLPQMFQAAGFQTEQKVSPTGKKYWVGKTQRDGWGYVIEVEPYFNNQQITGFWLRSPLGNPVNQATVSTNSLLNLLSLNHLQAPYFFSYNNNRIYLNYEYPYTQISQDNMRSELTRFMQKIFQTSSSWTNIHNGGK
jgi:hypothetical protein